MDAYMPMLDKSGSFLYLSFPRPCQADRSRPEEGCRAPCFPSPYYVNNFVFGQINRIGRSRGRRFPMRRGGPYLSTRRAWVDKVRRNNTESRHCSSSQYNIAPRERKKRRKKEREEGVACNCHMCDGHKIWIRTHIQRTDPLSRQKLN